MEAKSNKQTSKVVFLDIDGVLCLDGSNLDAHRLANLKKILTEGTDIVLSSTWRLYPKFVKQIHDTFDLVGIKHPIDHTPDLNNRGVEILEWLDNHPEVTHWVILDDFNIAKYEFRSEDKPRIIDHFVLTVFEHGLTEAKTEEAIQKLNA